MVSVEKPRCPGTMELGRIGGAPDPAVNNGVGAWEHHPPDLRSDTSMNRRLFEIGSMTGATGSALASGAASICCVGPIAITILGVQGAIWAAGVKPYRYYLLAGSLLFIGLAFRIVYRPPRFIAAASCSTRVGRFTKVLLWGSGAIWLAALVLNIAIDQTGL